jgi:opacity protein-like surface antigen
MTALLRLLLAATATLAAVSARADGYYLQSSLFRTNALAFKWVVNSGAIPEFAAFGVNRVTGTDHFNHGSGVSGEFGYACGPWRASLEYSHTDISDGFFDDSQGHAGPYLARQRYRFGLLNGYRDFRLLDQVSLFTGAGVGSGRLDHHLDTGVDRTDGSYGLFAYQFRGGLNVTLAERWSFTVALRFLHVDGGVNTITFPKSNFPFLQSVNTTTLTVDDAWIRSYEIGLRHTF